MGVIVNIDRTKIILYRKMHECKDIIPSHYFVVSYIYFSFLLGLNFCGLFVSIISLFLSFIFLTFIGMLDGAVKRKSIAGDKSKFVTLYITELKVNGRIYIDQTDLIRYPRSIGEYLYNKIKKVNNFKLYVLDNISAYFEKHKDD